MPTSYVFNKFKLKQFNGNAIDLDTDTIKCALYSAYTADLTHEYYSEVAAAGTECSGTNYTAGGKAITTPAFTGTTTVLFDCDAISWTSATITNARYLIFYKDTGNTATSPLIGYVDLGANYSVANGTFTVTPDSTNKLIKITSS